MSDQPTTTFVDGRVVAITGAASGFGRLTAQRLAALGASIVAADIDADGAEATATSILDAGGQATAVVCDVTDRTQMQTMVATAVETYGAVDVLVNNAGIMPLAFFADHEQAWKAWDRAIDINVKGTLHGIIAVYDQMIAQGRGHIVNLSSIYGNQGTAGSGVYSATKAAVNALSESLRVEAQGKIKVTAVRPTGVMGTGLTAGVVNPAAGLGLTGHNAQQFSERMMASMGEGLPPEMQDPDDVRYWGISPEELVEQIVHVIDLPWGIDVSDITVRATGEDYVN